MKKLSLVAAILLACSALSYGWGFFGHKLVHQLAIYNLPKPLQGFYFKHQDYIVSKSTRPDERRNDDPTEAPRHYIDIDVYGADAVTTMPEAWQAAAARYSADTLKKYGIVPWYVVEMKERLTNAFRQQNVDSILYYSADLGHYIADAHVPLHTTENYDGQMTGQPGLHGLWESKVPEQFAQNYKLHAAKAHYLPDVEKEIWKVVRSSFALTPQTLELEREASKNFTDQTKYDRVERNGKMRQYYSDAFATAYQEKLGPMVEQRLNAAAQEVANFWYTCWVDGGKPDMDKLMFKPLTKTEKKQLKLEKKAYRKGQLFTRNLVIAAKKPSK
ncbi:zinc dependent phospholipase C family protein [Pontibacter chitinilyticus]|uniref:zinc dependent phospholipase C family protein n=1 Tax=Pontibacter chitinilyticus TaxID=2674989 RepID=UPI00321B3922